MSGNINILAFQTRRRSYADAMTYLHGEFSDQINGSRPDFIVMPEKWVTDPMKEESQEMSTLLSFFLDLSERMDSVIVPGSFSVIREGALYNSSPVICSGKLAGWQDKISLFRMEKEKYTPGTDSRIFEAKGIRFAVSVCYDSDFPYYSRMAAMNGAELIINPVLIDGNFHDMWRVYVEARALENRLPFISVNSLSEPFLGNSILAVPEKYLFGARLNTRTYRSSPVIRRKISLDGLEELRTERLNEDPGSYGFK